MGWLSASNNWMLRAFRYFVVGQGLGKESPILMGSSDQNKNCQDGGWSPKGWPLGMVLLSVGITGVY